MFTDYVSFILNAGEIERMIRLRKVNKKEIGCLYDKDKVSRISVPRSDDDKYLKTKTPKTKFRFSKKDNALVKKNIKKNK